MTLPAPQGPLSKGELTIADKLVACSWFQKFTKTANDTDARAKIFFDVIPNADIETEVIAFPELQTQRPFVCIWPAQPAAKFGNMGGTNKAVIGIDYHIYLEADETDAVLDTPTIDAAKDNEIYRWWLNMIGVLLIGDTGLNGLLLLPEFALNGINNVDIWHTTDAEAGLGRFLSAFAVLETGTA